MATCPSCGEENPDRAKFCLNCATPLHEAPRSQAEERKVVTVLFCDLVGFTAASDHADPEEVRARIRPYHGMLRKEIEGFGGTVEKFIGDAVMAVWGAPVAHEDDPERASSCDLLREPFAYIPSEGLRDRDGSPQGFELPFTSLTRGNAFPHESNPCSI